MNWVFLNGCSVTGSAGSRTIPSGGLCTLAAVLVLNQGKPVQRDRINDILWEDSCPDRARDRVNTMLWRLRKILKAAGGTPDSVQNKREFLLYQPPEPDDSDIETIAELTRRLLRGGFEGPKQIEQALKCVHACHTDFLPHATDHWTIVTRESLRSGLLMILEALIRHMRGEGRWGRVSELVERMLALDPTLEIGHRQLIEMHGARKDMGSALRHYRVLEKVLHDRLDVDPSPETAAAIDALRIAGRNRPEKDDPPPQTERTIVKQAPSLQATQDVLNHLDAARDTLLR